MTDVVKGVFASGVRPQRPGNAYIMYSPWQSGQVITPKFYQTFPVSGHAGVVNNGYLDIRFDDPSYY